MFVFTCLRRLVISLHFTRIHRRLWQMLSWKWKKKWSKYSEEHHLDGSLGTTVTAVLIIGNILYIANVGDSDAVLCTDGKVIKLTESHVPSNPKERERIETVGGKILSDRLGNCRLGHPLWNPNFVNLGVTRSIGDTYYKSEEFVGSIQSGLIAEPNIVKWELTEKDEFLLIASDGFWDVISPDEAVHFVKKTIHMESDVICKLLMEVGKSRNSKDNVTILLIKFIHPSNRSTSSYL